ncbi:hypothetical protein A0H81_06455 [Grifola frondosa]|uniref:Fungal-type protein kinase domain-containing protein n=1 Tax=Grifola frondosa TaxID=5627 RepID=A0A1C7MBR4_GRIFR|nr:hypothetical protein A0H81_06455 [Grifola frondosa]
MSHPEHPQTPSAAGSLLTNRPSTPTQLHRTPNPSIPRSAKQSSTQERAVSEKHNKLTKHRIQLAKEMQGAFVEVELVVFNKKYTPSNIRGPPRNKAFKFNVKFKSEKNMYSGLCDGLNNALPPESGFVVKDTGNWEDLTADAGNHKRRNDKQPALGIYPTNDAALAAFTLDKKTLNQSKGTSIDARRPHMAKVSWAWLSVPTEVKADDSMAAFSYADGKEFLPDNDAARKARGQLADYAMHVLARQHRQFLFMIAICRDRARLLRWDRVGAVVSKPFDYIKSPELLGGWVYRYAKMTPAQRGFDPTATLATSDEVDMLKAAANSLTGFSEYAKQCLVDIIRPGWPIHKIEIGNGDDKRYFLVGYAMTASLSPTGRGTKGLVAYDITERIPVFMKDTWLPDSTEIHTERQVYERLQQHGAQNIATLLYSEDVGSPTPQRTRTQDLVGQFDKMILARIHCRLVFKEIGRSLQMYRNSNEMVFVIACAIVAHQQAWEKAGVLHRDISDGNVLIYDGSSGPVGILNDWDLARYKEELMKPAIQKSRSGTWQFMSALLLMRPEKQYTLSDDLESFIHLVNWLSLKYHRHKFSDSPTALASLIHKEYDECYISPDGCYDVGGESKLTRIQTGLPPVQLSDASALATLLRSLATLLKLHYETLDPSPFLLSGTAASTSTAPEVPTLSLDLPMLQPGKTNDPVFHNHNLVIMAFRDVVGKDTKARWIPNDKVYNKVATYTNSGTPVMSAWSSGTKRKAEEVLAPADNEEQPTHKKSKKSRKRATVKRNKTSRSTSNLPPIAEEVDDA